MEEYTTVAVHLAREDRQKLSYEEKAVLVMKITPQNTHDFLCGMSNVLRVVLITIDHSAPKKVL